MIFKNSRGLVRGSAILPEQIVCPLLGYSQCLGEKCEFLGDQRDFSLYVLEYLSDNCYVIFNEWMQSFGSKGLGAWGADEILSILKTFFMLIPSLSFLDFVLWKLKLTGLWPLSPLWQARIDEESFLVGTKV